MLKRHLKAILHPSSNYYFAMQQGKGAAFFKAECKGSIWQYAWNYRSRVKGVWYVGKLIFYRMVMPYVIVFGPILLVIATGAYCYHN